jgi:hypothetical protein
MTATGQQEFWQEQEDDPIVHIDGRVDPCVEDAYWQSAFWGQSYYRAECSFDDYAPAYCVGYIGYAQYGGNFDDAEKSLCANWVRIKGDSRLTLDEAMQAIRAAWEHAAAGDRVAEDEGEVADVALVAAAARQAQARHAYATA